ncbi:hypothetical protein CTI12_AA010880 [Artemisia annua]|uniref:Ubiquitin-like protease family profile domain-containing protein n=1 Tax=Artemisia annua TaxID=35608 RepID=A0A2U1QAR2_ARTAN|nr:hypothetical protein CTI12_AA010880 [Artemisia annua]
MGKNDGPAFATIDLTSDQEMDDVSGVNGTKNRGYVNVSVVGTGFDGGNRRTRTKSVPFKKRPVGSLEGDVFLPSVVGDQQEVVEASLANKGNRMRSKFFIVSKEQVGKKTAVKRKVGLNKKRVKKGLVDEDKDDEEDVYNEVGGRKRIRKSKLVGEAVTKNKDEKGVGCKVPDVDRVHQRISLWSLHRLLPNLSPKQREDVTEMGFGAVLRFSIKDIPTRLGYWLLDNFDEDRCVLNVDGKEISITRETVRDVLGIPMGDVPVEAVDEADFRHPLVVEWKKQFESTTRYKHIPVEKQIYTQQAGGWMFNLNLLVLYFTSIGESNKNATVNLSYVLQCLVRTKKSWIRTSHYCGPVIVLLVVYAESLREKSGNADVQMPLVNNWTVDVFNKLEEDRFTTKTVEEIVKSVGAKYTKAGGLIHEADEELDEALEQNPTDARLIQMKEVRDVLFRSRVFSEPANESKKPTEEANDGGYCTPGKDEPFPFTQFYGTPSAYVAYSEQVSAERIMKESKLRSDQLNVSKFDLNITQPPATQGRSVDVSGVENCFDEAEELLESFSLYDSQDLPHFDCFTPEKLIVGRQESGVSNSSITPYTICDVVPLQTIVPKEPNVRPKRQSRPAEVLCSPWVRRACSLVVGLGRHEKRVSDCLFSGRFAETDILFQTDYAYAPRIVFESLCPGIEISSEAVDMFTKVLNDAEKYRDPKKQMCKVFCDTSLMREWDVHSLADKNLDVKVSADKFIKGMMAILQSTVYGTLSNVDLVFFPIIQDGHFIVVCVHLKRREIHILDNMLLGSENVSDRYGGLVDFLVARFEDFLSNDGHPAQGFLRNADPQLLRLGCMTKNNVIDCGVFAMRHMETYLFGGEYDDLCEFRREGKEQQHQLDELRKKYAAKILLCDINEKKAVFESEAEAHRLLPPEERQRLEAASFETCKRRVRDML